MIDLKDMKLFCLVVAQGSFAAAAKQMQITPAMVGRRVAEMEKKLGFILLNRSTRKMQLTPGGQSYYEGCLRLISDAEDLEASVSAAHQNQPKGLITLSAPDGLGGRFIATLVRDFRLLYPDISFDLRLTNMPLDLIEDKIDLTLRLTHEVRDAALVATKLVSTKINPFASEEYLKRKGYPQHKEDLQHHDIIHMNNSRFGNYWNIIEDGKEMRFGLEWTVVTPNTLSMIQATIDGVGISTIPEIFIHAHAQRDKLVRLEGLVTFPDIALYALYPTRKHLPYRVNLFLDFLKKWVPEYMKN